MCIPLWVFADLLVSRFISFAFFEEGFLFFFLGPRTFSRTGDGGGGCRCPTPRLRDAHARLVVWGSLDYTEIPSVHAAPVPKMVAGAIGSAEEGAGNGAPRVEGKPVHKGLGCEELQSLSNVCGASFLGGAIVVAWA